MAATRVSQFTELSSAVALTDVVGIVDVSDTTMSADGSTRKLRWDRLTGRLNHICQGRLTLVSGDPHYAPQPSTPSATDTTADTCDFAAAHGWATGTMVTPSVDGGGLTWNTIYYIRAVDSDTVSFHPTFADADANTNKVNLTASITAIILPLGVTSKTLYFTPYLGNLVSLYDATRWQSYSFSEVSLSISALTANKNYDIFLYDNAGTLTLELSAAWTSDTVRADALATQDGVDVKSGAATRRWLGTLRAFAAAEVEDSCRKRFLWNAYHRVPRNLFRTDIGNWTYTTAAYRQANGNSANKVEVLCGKAGTSLLSLECNGRCSNSSVRVFVNTAIGENGVATAKAHFGLHERQPTSTAGATDPIHMHASYDTLPRLGYSEYLWLEYSDATGTTTWTGTGSGSAITMGLNGHFAA